MFFSLDSSLDSLVGLFYYIFDGFNIEVESCLFGVVR